MSSKPVFRFTLFKIPSVQDQDALLAMYKEMPQKAQKVSNSQCCRPRPAHASPLVLIEDQDGEPYIRSVRAGKTENDARNQDYTVSVVTEFASMDDFVYYDTKCEAHGSLKAFAKTVHKGNLMCFFEPAF